MVGNDVLFGDGQDDNIIGGYGSDWISGGTGDDGILGDDGRMYVSRISSTFGEPLYGIAAIPAAEIDMLISTPGNAQQADHQPGGRAQVHGRPHARQPRPGNPAPTRPSTTYHRPLFANDIIYGGLGDDSIHGGAGDDAISGAEAPTESYTNNYDQNGNLLQADLRSDFFHPLNPGNVLGYSPTGRTRRSSRSTTRTTRCARSCSRRSPARLHGRDRPEPPDTACTTTGCSNFDYTEGPLDTHWIVGSSLPGVPTDGNDMLFGDLQQRLGRRRHRPRHHVRSAGATTSRTPTTS